CNVDAGRALAPARLARNTELECLCHFIGSECIRPQLAGYSKAQSIGTAARDVALVAGDTIARTHDAAGERAASPIVVAPLHGALESAASPGIGGPIELRAHFLAAVIDPVTEQSAVVEFRRAHDLAGIEDSARIKDILDPLEGMHKPRAEHLFVE